MNRVVYDSVNQQSDKNEEQKGEQDNSLPTPTNCDNDAKFDPYYTQQSKTDYTLNFESRFESGNLRRAIQVYEFEYDLILKPDYLTKVNN